MNDAALGLVALGSCGLLGVSAPGHGFAYGYRVLQYGGLLWLTCSFEGSRELFELLVGAALIWLTADIAESSAEGRVL